MIGFTFAIYFLIALVLFIIGRGFVTAVDKQHNINFSRLAWALTGLGILAGIYFAETGVVLFLLGIKAVF